MLISVRNTSIKVHKLEQDAQSFGAIASAVRGFSKQINLLAINAVIEAVLAGEQGGSLSDFPADHGEVDAKKPTCDR